MTQLTLISHHLCPYVQRAAIALAEKGAQFERVNINLADKPTWFRAISPLGKVPLLRVGPCENETVIFESVAILEYLEETQPKPLHPTDPLVRARHRGWIEFGSAMLNAIARLYGAKGQAVFDREASGLGQMADQLEAELQSRGSHPWFEGTGFSLVDAVFASVFRYFDGFEANAGLRLLDGRPELAAWRQQLARHPSVQAAIDHDYPERLKHFFVARGGILSAMISD